MNKTTLSDKLSDLGAENALTMDGFDNCVIGVLERFGMENIVLYDRAKVIEKLVEDGCDNYEGAVEYYEHNQLGGWHGDGTPGFLIRFEKEVIHITQENKWGQSRNYPACKMSKLLCRLTNTKTLPDRMIRDIEDSKLFEVKVLSPPPVSWRTH